MIKKLSTHRIYTSLVVSLIVFACAIPSLGAQPAQQVNTLAPGALATIVAGTANAAQTQTIISIPTSTITFSPTATLFPTRTPVTPSPTPTFIIAFTMLTKVTPITETLTPSPGPISLSSSSSSSKGPTSTLSDEDERATRFPKIPLPWNCIVTSKTPLRGTVIKPKQNFVVSWTVKNNGTKTWTSNTIDFIYTGGYRSTERPIQDLTTTVAPGGSITLKVQLQASKFPGDYNTFWSLRVGNTKFCHMKGSFEIGSN